jgi:hypothetical protein
MLLFGQLFSKVTTIEGFESGSYVQFLAPGISIMTALFGAAYSGMGILGDIDRGVLDRMLATPVSRGAVIAGRILHSAVQVIVQASIPQGRRPCHGGDRRFAEDPHWRDLRGLGASHQTGWTALAALILNDLGRNGRT